MTERNQYPGPVSRPRSVEEMNERLAYFSGEESKTAADNLVCRPDDVFIATYPKCGTTLLQQMVHALRTGGHMDFGEITDVVPWLEQALNMGVDPDAEQHANPRAFKTHRSFSDLPQNGRLIHMTRDPLAMADSFYRFFSGWVFEKGSIDIDSFVEDKIFGGSGSGRYWDHLADWWPMRRRENVCFLCYEDFIEDPAKTIEVVANFIGIPLDEELRKTVLEATSIKFMKSHGSKFDDHVMRAIVDPAMGLPADGSASKVDKGSSTVSKQSFSSATLKRFDELWQEEIESPLGVKSYDNLRRELNG